MKNYAVKMGYSIPKTLEAVTFADNAQISSWAKDAVKAMQQAGVLSGKENNRFDPKSNATRTEAATVLHRFVEIVIDPQSANGWQQNDSGEWSYYKDGEPVKGWLSDNRKRYWLDSYTGKMFSGGWKQISGKWYYFYADGSMAVSTKVDGYKVGTDGARKQLCRLWVDTPFDLSPPLTGGDFQNKISSPIRAQVNLPSLAPYFCMRCFYIKPKKAGKKHKKCHRRRIRKDKPPPVRTFFLQELPIRQRS